MEFILKKSKDGKSSISDIELAKLLEIATLKKNIQNTKSSVEEIKSAPKVDKKYVMDLVKSEFRTNEEILNITQPASIEKLNSIKEGSIYYNKELGVRIKTGDGWKTLITE